jgi:hypothetical protein
MEYGAQLNSLAHQLKLLADQSKQSMVQEGEAAYTDYSPNRRIRSPARESHGTMIRSKSRSPTMKAKKTVKRKSKSPTRGRTRSRSKSNEQLKRNIGLGDNWVSRLEQLRENLEVEGHHLSMV